MRDRPSFARALVAAVLGVAAAFAARLLLQPWLGDKAPFITFLAAAFALGWWGGIRPALIATVASIPVIACFMLEPRFSLAIDDAEYRVAAVIYALVGLGTGWLGELLHAARRMAQEGHREAAAERERLRVTLASIGDAVIVTDEQGLVASLNAAAESLTGWREEKAKGKRLEQVFRIVNEDTRQGIEDPCARVRRTGAIVGLANHTLLIARDGTERPIDDCAAPILDASGQFCGVILVFRDVTEKRRANKALIRSQRELADLFENSALPIHSVGPDGVILRANHAELDMLGYAREEYIGQHIARFHVDRRVIDDILTRLSRGEILHNYESQLRCKDGSIKDVLITSSVLWEEGRFIHTRCFTRDITDRKRAEESMAFLASATLSLAELTDHQSALQDAVRVAVPFFADWCVIYVVDDQHVIEHQAYAHRDREKERVLAAMLAESPLDWESNTATVRALRTEQTQLYAELPDALLARFAKSEAHRRMIGELDPQSVISVPLRIRERTIGVMSFVASGPRRYTEGDVKFAENIAYRTATAVDNAQLFHAVKEASRQKDEFLAMLAHELRNPLAAIRYAGALGQMTPGESMQELFEIIDRQTQNLAHLIEDLLDVSRISRNKVTLRKEPVQVAAIVNRAVATVRPLIEEKRHELALDVHDQSMTIFADPTRAEQIVANLLTNAAKYTPEGGRVSLRAYRDDADAVIQVTDTGVGMPPEMLARVFDLFAQADASLDRSQGGLGIGLTVARKLAEMHGGTVAAFSEGLGRGATFTVRLPLSEVDQPAEPSSPFDAPTDRRRKLRILVVDDNRDTAVSGALMLKTLGHEVETAFDGPTALEMARSFRPQALFLDIGLPGMTGYEVAQKLREEGFQDETIVAVSGYGQAEDRRRSREAGFDHHLVKPVDRDTLVAVLQGNGGS